MAKTGAEISRAYIARHRDDPAWKAKRAAYGKAYRKANVERVREISRQSKTRLAYGMEPDEYQAFIANGCEICGSHERMHVDHDHATGKVRGALCQGCNIALGCVEDDIDRLLDLANYLKRHR